jgi:hypothetical protein
MAWSPYQISSKSVQWFSSWIMWTDRQKNQPIRCSPLELAREEHPTGETESMHVHWNQDVCKIYWRYNCSVLCYGTWHLKQLNAQVLGWPPLVDDFAGHPVLPTHLPDRIVNVIGESYTQFHTLSHPKWHKTKYTNFMAMNSQRKMRFI